MVHLPVQDPEVHPVAAVQVGARPGHRALHFAALPRDLHLRLPGTTGLGEESWERRGGLSKVSAAPPAHRGCSAAVLTEVLVWGAAKSQGTAL